MMLQGPGSEKERLDLSEELDFAKLGMRVLNAEAQAFHKLVTETGMAHPARVIGNAFVHGVMVGLLVLEDVERAGTLLSALEIQRQLEMGKPYHVGVDVAISAVRAFNRIRMEVLQGAVPSEGTDECPDSDGGGSSGGS